MSEHESIKCIKEIADVSRYVPMVWMNPLVVFQDDGSGNAVCECQSPLSVFKAGSCRSGLPDDSTREIDARPVRGAIVTIRYVPISAFTDMDCER